MYVYIQTEPTLFTVGFHSPNGEWHPDSDHPTRKEAAQQVAKLNGSHEAPTISKELLPPSLLVLNIDICEDENFQWLRGIVEATNGDLKTVDHLRRKANTARNPKQLIEAEKELKTFIKDHFTNLKK